MEHRQHSLRTLALKLNVSGTAEVLDEPKLYQGGYGFIKLQIYAPKTQNTEAPLCTVFKTTVDELGREKVSGVNHNLVCAGEYTLDGEIYLLFENYLPKPFTDIAGDLKITVNYYDTAPTLDSGGNTLYDVNGVPLRHATDLLISNQYVTKVAKGGYNADGVELAINSAEAAQINDNLLRIISLEYDVSGLHNYIDTAVGEIHTQYEIVVEEGKRLATASAESASKAAQTVEDGKSEIADIIVAGQTAVDGSVERAARSATEAFEQTEEARKVLAKTQEFSAAAANSEANAENWAEVAKSFARFGIKVNMDYPSVSNLPQPGDAQYLYLVPNGSSNVNSYDEYIWADAKQAYEKLGTTQIDLTDYATKVELTAAIQEEANARESALLPKADNSGIYPEMTVGNATNAEYAESATNATNDGDGNNIAQSFQSIREDMQNESHFRGYLTTDAEIQTVSGTPNDYAYSAESGTVWIYQTATGWTDSGKPVPDQTTPASNASPLMDGSASVGTAESYARGDHRHPSDIMKASVSDIVHYGVCGSAATTSAKIVRCDNGFVLKAGARITVKFTYANTVDGGIALNVNNTGAKSIIADGDLTHVKWLAGAVMDFVYDGTSWVCVGGYALQGKRVGSLYISTNNTSPASLFGGSWTAITSEYYLKAANSGGIYSSAGLPNIIGSISGVVLNDGAIGEAGAMTYVWQNNNAPRDDGNLRHKVYTVSLNASNYNSIYGNSTTVTPLNYSVCMWRRTA